MPHSVSLSTLGDPQRSSYRLYANCYCGHGRPLNLAMLIERYGEDDVFINESRIASALVCQRCWRRGARLTLQPG